MAGDRAIEAVGEAVQQDERQRCRVALQRQQRPGAATDDEAAPGDTVGGDATAREAPPESLERRVADISPARRTCPAAYASVCVPAASHRGDAGVQTARGPAAQTDAQGDRASVGAGPS